MSKKNLILISIITGIVAVAFGVQKLVYKYVDLRGNEPIQGQGNEEGADHGHDADVPEEHED